MTAPPATSNANLRDEPLESMAITIYGVVVLTFMMAMYAFERRDRRFIAAFAMVACCPVPTASSAGPGHSA